MRVERVERVEDLAVAPLVGSSPLWMRAIHGFLKVVVAIIVLGYRYGAAHGDELPRLSP